MSNLPDGATDRDIDRGVSRLDDASQEELWEMLTEQQQTKIDKDFLRIEGLDAISEADGDSANDDFGEQFRQALKSFRSAAVNSMYFAGTIRPEQTDPLP